MSWAKMATDDRRLDVYVYEKTMTTIWIVHIAIYAVLLLAFDFLGARSRLHGVLIDPERLWVEAGCERL